MSDLRDKMLKAGLITEEQAKKSEPPKPPPRPQRPGGDRPPQQPREQREPQPLDEDTKNRLKQLAVSGKLDGKTRGQRRWYYTSRRGVVPYLELSDEVVGQLEQGGAAIAEAPNGDTWLVTGECAKKLRDLHADGAREWLRVFNGR